MTGPSDIAPPVPPTLPPVGREMGEFPADGSAVRARQPAPMGNVLRAFFFKESRDLAPWTIGAFTILACTLIIILVTLSDQVAQRNWYYSTAIPPHMSFSSILCPLIGLVIGYVQFYWETSAGRVTILLHRPVSRPSLLLAKGSIGLLLYLLTTGVPLFAALFWLSKPYNVPHQFYWFMALPFLSDVLTGIPAYLAGMLLAYSFEGRWRFSYLLPIVIPFACAVLCFIATSFALALLIIVVSTVPLLIAAAGLFVAARGRGRQPVVSRITLAIMQYVALLFLGVVILILLQNAYRSITRFYPTPSQAFRTFLPDGTPTVQIYDSARLSPIVYVYADDLQLKVRGEDGRKFLGMQWLVNPYQVFYSGRSIHEPYAYADAFAGGGRFTSWSVAPSGDYMVAYNIRQPSLAGSIGPDGFHPGVKVPPTRFASPVIPLANPLWQKDQPQTHNPGATFFAAENAIWALSQLGEFRGDVGFVRRIFTLPSPDPILAATTLGQTVDSTSLIETKRYVVLGTKTGLYFLAPEQGQLRFLFRYSNPQLNMANLKVGLVVGASEFVIESSDGPVNQPTTETQVRVFYFSEDGSKSRELVLPPVPFEEREADRPVPERLLYAAALPAPANVVDAFFRQRSTGVINQGWTLFRRAEPKEMELGLSLVSAGFCAVLAWLYGRKFLLPIPAVIGWTMGALLLGIPGLVVMVLTHRLPLLVPCPNCQRKRLASAEKCPYCGSAFPDPASNGTEVFA